MEAVTAIGECTRDGARDGRNSGRGAPEIGRGSADELGREPRVEAQIRVPDAQIRVSEAQIRVPEARAPPAARAQAGARCEARGAK